MYEQAFLFQEWKRGFDNMIEISKGLSTPHFNEQQYHISMELKKEVKYTKRHLLRELEEKMESVARSFTDAIKWYLEKKYDMDIELVCTEEMKKKSDWKEQDYIKEIIDQLRVQFGESSRDDIQLQQLADKILEKEPIQNGRVLEFSSEHSHAWRYSIAGNSIHTEFIKSVLSAVSYKENETFDLSQDLETMLKFSYHEADVYTLPSVDKYKVFKNGKLSITFSTKDALSSFMKMLEENKTN